MFDKIMLLAEGSTVFWGKFSQAISFFDNSGFPCPKFENPADYFLDLINTKDEFRNLDVKSPKEKDLSVSRGALEISEELSKHTIVGERKEIVSQLSSQFVKSKLFQNYRDEQQKIEESFAKNEDNESILKRTFKKNNDLYQFSVLLRRSFWYKLREPNVLMSQITTAIFVGLLVRIYLFVIV
jgi:hypothetical protein